MCFGRDRLGFGQRYLWSNTIFSSFFAAIACSEPIRPLTATSDVAMAMVNIAAIIVLSHTK